MATMDDKQVFASAFDEALWNRFASIRAEFLRSRGDHYFSDETDATLAAKLELVRDRMSQGRSLAEVCDDPDVYLGWLDRKYISHCLDSRGFGETHLDLTTFRRNHAYGEAVAFIRRACHDECLLG